MLQADPRFVAAAAGDFRVLNGSPAIDAAHSGVAGWPATDFVGAGRLDDPRSVNRGEGPVTYGDLGVFEFVPSDAAPIVISPSSVSVARGGTG